MTCTVVLVPAVCKLHCVLDEHAVRLALHAGEEEADCGEGDAGKDGQVRHGVKAADGDEQV